MKNTFIAISVLFFLGCTTTDHRLIGTWISDKEKTIALMKSQCQVIPEKRLALFENILGDMKITYAEKYAIITFEGKTTKEKYKIVASDHDSVVLKAAGLFGDQEVSIITFDGDYYYTYSEFGGMAEYFKKVQ